MGEVSDHRFRRLECLSLALLVSGHVAVGREEVGLDDMRTDKRLDELGDMVPTHDLMQAAVHLVIHTDRQFSVHAHLLRNQYVLSVLLVKRASPISDA